MTTSALPAQVEKAADAYLQACEQGVDLAKATFMSKLVGVGSATAILGVSAGLAGISMGAAVPLIAISGARLVVAASDAACAWRCLRDARAAAAGTLVEKPLPMGANGLGNLLHKAFTGCGLAFSTATRYATTGAAVLSAGLAIAGMATSIAGPIAMLAGKVVRLVAGSASLLLSPAETLNMCKDQRNKFDRQETLKTLHDTMTQEGLLRPGGGPAPMPGSDAASARDRLFTALASKASVPNPVTPDPVNTLQTHGSRAIGVASVLNLVRLGAQSLA